MENQTKIPRSGFAVVSVVMGVLGFIPGIGLLFALLAVIFGIIAKLEIKDGLYEGKGLYKIGIILGIIAALFTFAIYGFLYYRASQQWSSFTQLNSLDQELNSISSSTPLSSVSSSSPSSITK